MRESTVRRVIVVLAVVFFALIIASFFDLTWLIPAPMAGLALGLYFGQLGGSHATASGRGIRLGE